MKENVLHGFSFLTNKKRSRGSSSGVLLTVCKANRKRTGEMQYQLNIIFYADTIEKFHMRKGDKISFGFNEIGQVAIIDDESGYMLSSSTLTLKIGATIGIGLPEYVNKDMASVSVPLTDIVVNNKMLILNTRVNDFIKTSPFPKI